MKTIYLQRNKNHRGNFKNAIIVLALFVLGFLVLSIFRNGVLTTISPLLNLKNVVLEETFDFFSYFRTKDSLINENKFLKNQLLSQESLLVSYNSLNNSYNHLLEASGQISKEVKIAAGVLTSPPQSVYDILIIDVGKDKGVEVGSSVTLPFGILIGNITAVGLKTSQVTLTSSYGIKTEAVLERTQTPVTLTGQGGGNLIIRVPRDIEVVSGDRILSPGFNPRLLGVVGDVSVQSTDSFKRVLATIPGGISAIRYVYILK